MISKINQLKRHKNHSIQVIQEQENYVKKNKVQRFTMKRAVKLLK